MKKCLFTLVILISAGLCKAQDGTPDFSFGINGVANADSVNMRYPFFYTATQPNGNIVMATAYQHYSPIAMGFVVKCFLPDGSLAPNFNPQCRIQTSSDFDGERLYGMVALSDGSIILAGSQTVYGLLPDGHLNYTFGDSGKVRPGYTINSMALQSGDRIILAGVNADNGLSTTRLHANGILDITYGSNGTEHLGVPDTNLSTVNGIAIGSADEIIICGTTSYNTYGGILLRLTAAGKIDKGFADAGYLQFWNGYDPAVDAIRFQQNGKILLAGRIGNILSFLARFNADGTLDYGFANDGILYVDTVSGTSKSGNFMHSSVSIQKDGRILHTINHMINNGVATLGTVLRRFSPAGVFDTTFGNHGKALAQIEDVAMPGDIILQSNGRVVLAAAGGFEDGGVGVRVPTLRSFYLIGYLSSLELGVLSFKKSDNALSVYPNPISESATVHFELASPGRISIDLLDITGKAVQHFIKNEQRAKGIYTEKLMLNKDLRSGMYILNIHSDKAQYSIRVTKE